MKTHLLVVGSRAVLCRGVGPAAARGPQCGWGDVPAGSVTCL